MIKILQTQKNLRSPRHCSHPRIMPRHDTPNGNGLKYCPWAHLDAPATEKQL